MFVVFVSREKDEWLCTFCVFKMSQEYLDRHEQSREEVMSCNMSQHLLVRPLWHTFVLPLFCTSGPYFLLLVPSTEVPVSFSASVRL